LMIGEGWREMHIRKKRKMRKGRDKIKGVKVDRFWSWRSIE
jgi:hypothetical protein